MNAVPIETVVCPVRERENANDACDDCHPRQTGVKLCEFKNKHVSYLPSRIVWCKRKTGAEGYSVCLRLSPRRISTTPAPAARFNLGYSGVSRALSYAGVRHPSTSRVLF